MYYFNIFYKKLFTDNAFLQQLYANWRERNVAQTSSDPCNAEPEVTIINKKKGFNCWNYSATKSLIRSMATHIGDLHNVKKRKHVYTNVSNDLESENYSFDEAACQNKWKGLVRSYQKCKDMKTRTGQGASRFLYFDDLEDILGSKPTNECTHSINSTFQCSDEPKSQPSEKTSEKPEKTAPKNINTKSVIRKEYETLKIKYMEARIAEIENKNKRHQEIMDIEKTKIKLIQTLLTKFDKS